MAAVVNRVPRLFAATTRQFSVGASLSASKNQSPPVEDPVKRLFLDKIKEYKTKAKGGKLPGMTPEAEKGLTDEMSRLKHIYGEGDLSKFPSFNFKD